MQSLSHTEQAPSLLKVPSRHERFQTPTNTSCHQEATDSQRGRECLSGCDGENMLTEGKREGTVVLSAMNSVIVTVKKKDRLLDLCPCLPWPSPCPLSSKVKMLTCIANLPLLTRDMSCSLLVIRIFIFIRLYKNLKHIFCPFSCDSLISKLKLFSLRKAYNSKTSVSGATK